MLPTPSPNLPQLLNSWICGLHFFLCSGGEEPQQRLTCRGYDPSWGGPFCLLVHPSRDVAASDVSGHCPRPSDSAQLWSCSSFPSALLQHDSSEQGPADEPELCWMCQRCCCCCCFSSSVSTLVRSWFQLGNSQHSECPTRFSFGESGGVEGQC